MGRPPLIGRIEKVLEYMKKGLSFREIGRVMGLPVATVYRAYQYSQRPDYVDKKKLDSVSKTN